MKKIVFLPWIPTLMNNFQLAKAILNFTLKKLFNIKKNNEVEKVLVKWENLEISEEIQEKENQMVKTHYFRMQNRVTEKK